MSRLLQLVREQLIQEGDLVDHPGNLHRAITNAPDDHPIHNKMIHSDLPYSFTVNSSDVHKHLGIQPKHLHDYIKKYNGASEKQGWVDGGYSRETINGKEQISFDHGG